MDAETVAALDVGSHLTGGRTSRAERDEEGGKDRALGRRFRPEVDVRGRKHLVGVGHQVLVLCAGWRL
jgi:hypothetical protein